MPAEARQQQIGANFSGRWSEGPFAGSPPPPVSHFSDPRRCSIAGSAWRSTPRARLIIEQASTSRVNWPTTVSSHSGF